MAIGAYKHLHIVSELRDAENMVHNTGMNLGLLPANERRRYFATTSLIVWVQA